MTQVSVSDFRQNLPSYLDKVLAGEEFEVVRNRVPVARVSPASRKAKKVVKKILPEAFGMWKDRWPKSKSSVDIVNEWRREILYGKNDN